MNFVRLPDYGHLETWGILIGGYQFVITYDKQLDAWAASYKNRKHLDKPAVFLGDNVHPEQKVPFHKSMIEAERACEKAYKELRQPN